MFQEKEKLICLMIKDAQKGSVKSLLTIGDNDADLRLSQMSFLF